MKAARTASFVGIVICLLGAAFLGCAGKKPEAKPQEPAKAEAKPPIKVGVPGPFSGAAAEKGRHLRFGVEVAVEEINAAGGVLGRRIEPVYVDTEAKTEVGVSAYEKAITRDKVDFIVGEVNSHVALAVLDVIGKYGIPTIFAIPASDELGKKVKSAPDKYGCVFMTDPPTSKMYEGAFIWLDKIIQEGKWKPKEKTLALVIEDSDWGRTVGQMWRREMTARGWDVVVDETVPFGESEFYPVITKIKQKNPALVKIELTSLPAGVSITKQMAEMGVGGLIFGGYYQKTAEFPKMVGNLADYSLNIREPYPESWKEKLTKKFPEADPIASMYSYDSMYILKGAVERAKSTEPKAVVNELAKTDYEGVFMRTVYDPETHFALVGEQYKFYGVGQIRDGNLYLIFPEKHAQKAFEVPPAAK